MKTEKKFPEYPDGAEHLRERKALHKAEMRVKFKKMPVPAVTANDKKIYETKKDNPGLTDKEISIKMNCTSLHVRNVLARLAKK